MTLMPMRTLLTVSVLLALAACPKDPPAESLPSGPASTPAPLLSSGRTAPPPIAPRAPGLVGDVLDAYDGVHAALARDDAAGAAKSAGALATAAHGIAVAAAGPTKQPLTDLAAAAAKLAGAGDLVAARAAFGDVSKDVVALLVADPALQTGRFLFLCPMTKGYQKWVQTTVKVENPFFGKEMPDCGEQLKAWSV